MESARHRLSLRSVRGARFALLFGVLGVALALAVEPIAAQTSRSDLPYRKVDDPNLDDAYDFAKASPFNLQGLGDFARTGVPSTGTARWCYSNTGIFEPYAALGRCFGQQSQTQDGTRTMWFEIAFTFVAPPGDMPDHVREKLDEGVLRGGGYTYQGNLFDLTGDTPIMPSDRSGVEFLEFGVTSTSDGSCRDFRPFSKGGMDEGMQLLPSNSCAPTWPGGQWKGRPKLNAESFLEARQLGVLGDDPFAFWRVPAELAESEFMGDFHTFAEAMDYSRDLLPQFGSVVPNGAGNPTRAGWPLGIDIWVDGFYFNLPTVNNAYFYQITVVNNSEQVYGVGQTYDSLYFGLRPDPLISPQNGAPYNDISRGAWVFNLPGSGACVTGSPPVPPGSGGCGDNFGFRRGAAGIITLKSPIGDLRNKLLSDPTSPFFEPTHPNAGDTITLNHAHICQWSNCYSNSLTRGPRPNFGMWSSTEINVLDGRSPAELTEAQLWRTFRSENWPGSPAEIAQFNRYIPGIHDDNPIWDWNKDGIPDTLYLDDCGRRGCVDLWGDTLPNGAVLAGTNQAAIGIGPVRMEPGDTAAWVMAVISAPDRPGFEALMDNVVDFYLNFYLGPKAPAPPRVVGVDTRIGDTRVTRVSLYVDDAASDTDDEFMADLVEKIEEADPATELGKLRALNPWIVDSVRSLVSNNVAALHLFKSCDGGQSWTSTSDCFGNPVPAADPTAKFRGLGFLPYRTLEPDADGRFPNIVLDGNVLPGKNYLYTFVTESRGAIFNVLKDTGPGEVPVDGSGMPFCDPTRCEPSVDTLAPPLFSPLTRSTADPQVAAVYLPVSRAAGERDPEVSIERMAGASTSPFGVTFAGRDVAGGNFRAIFGDRVYVTRINGQSTVRVQDTEYVLPAGATEAELRVMNEQTFTTTRDVTTSRTGAPVDGEPETTQFGFAMVLLNEANEPLVVSTTLTGEGATPGSFLTRPDFPYFFVEANNTVGGQFAGQDYRHADGRSIASRVLPSMRWLSANSAPLAGRFGEYRIRWADDAFGPNAPFRRERASDMRAAALASIAARQSASRSRNDVAALEAVEAANVSFDPQGVPAVDLPFTIENLTYGHDVDVVVVRQERSFIMGTGSDTVRVNTPAEAWIPGDQLVLIESFEADSLVTAPGPGGGNVTALALDGAGNPIRSTRTAATWRLVLGCTTPRATCDPTIHADPTVGGSGYIPARDNVVLTAHYYVPFTASSQYGFTVTPAVLAKDLAPRDWDLSKVKVVPNPYRFFNEWEQPSPGAEIRFTNLPPEGRIRIFTAAGQFVQEIRWVPEDLMGGLGTSGDLPWDLQSRERTEISYGLYLWVLETPDGRRQAGKFVVLR